MYLCLEVKDQEAILKCNMCGYAEAQERGGLVSEIYVKERGSEAYKIDLNEFTRQDPTLPHLKTMKCPNTTCATNTGAAEKDVIYIKYDPENLKFLYICTVCDAHWRSSSRS
jgi:DNA-directed RNA polymerase subunit M/transcription elongation factor TFIIS